MNQTKEATVSRKRVIIMGAAGRDFHNFNTFFRDREEWEVVAFTATQIPDIEGRRYPPSLAGRLYPEGIPIHPEEALTDLVARTGADFVVFSYSDVSHQHVMASGAAVLAAGGNYLLLGARDTMLASSKPVISVCAVRTGCGKSQTTRFIGKWLAEKGKKVVVVRHPMPYGDLEKQRVQRFASTADMDAHDCTIEEREEYEHHIAAGHVVYAGVDYEAILREAEAEADIVLWDGGNNDVPFFRPDLEVVVVDPLRAGHETTYYPGMVNFLRAQALIVNKVNSAHDRDVAALEASIAAHNPKAAVIKADSVVEVSDPAAIAGKRVLVVEDGPTLTHGEMSFGAGTVAAREHGAAEIVDPRPFAVGSIQGVYEQYADTMGQVLPAMGYGQTQMEELQATIQAADCDLVVVATPIDLGRLIQIDTPGVRVTYRLQESGEARLPGLLERFV